MKRLSVMVAMAVVGLYAGLVMADVPGRPIPSGIVPNPGTQQQELSNITAPGTYNVFEFPNFCAGCHGGTLDQNMSHYGNWAGSNMANSGRDPFFRTNNLVVNSDAYYITKSLGGSGANGVGNICWRCHSPNGWYSARLDETAGGRIDGSTIEQSLLKSTDMQGISCEFCHRTIGNVTMQRADLNQNDPAWLLLAGATDWPHVGNPYPEGPVAGNPYGDTTFQFNDGKVYQADLPGNQLLFWSDLPTSGSYTGQTYGIYPAGLSGNSLYLGQTPLGQPAINALGQTIAYLPDGRSKIHYEESVNPPNQVDPLTLLPIPGTRDYEQSSISPRHATHMGGSTQDGLTASGNRYLPTAEMCGTCHDLTVPTLNSGMPEQRTYTEWKYSRFGRTNFICQDCHMGELQHESKDGMAGTFKADPQKAGFFPYAKPRPASAIHKFNPANRDLGPILAYLNPEVDLEVTGKPSGEDTRTNNGVLSNRNETYARQSRNGELKLRDAARIEITQQPTLVSGTTYEVKVKVTNLTGHAFPSGYPDGRRAFVTLNVFDGSNANVYQSGFYDDATAELKTTAATAYKRAQSPVIDATVENAVMTYEKKTGWPNGDGSYKITESLLNPVIVFDNRLHPAGWTSEFFTTGIRIVNYTGSETAAIPFNEPTRYGAMDKPRLDVPSSGVPGTVGSDDAGAHWDVITYRFNSATVPTRARAEIFYQSHSRDFVEYLKNRNNEETYKDLYGDPNDPARPNTLGGPKPEGTPSIYAANYPFTPNYLGDNINVTGMTDLNGQPLMNNWGSVLYAAWLNTGKGAPFSIDVADTTATAIPAAPAVTATSLSPFKTRISWGAVAGAEKYVVLARYGTAGTNNIWGVGGVNASWDRLAIVASPATSFDHVVKPGKTYGYQVYAVNDASFSDPLNDKILEFNFGLGGADAVTGTLETVNFSNIAEVTTPGATPTEPKNLQTVAAYNKVKLTWVDQSIDETSFVVERQPVNADGTRGAFAQVAEVGTVSAAGTLVLNAWTDTAVTAGTSYNYRVAAKNVSAQSVYSDIKGATTPNPGTVVSPGVLVVPASNTTGTYQISWAASPTTGASYVLQESTDSGFGTVSETTNAVSPFTVSNKSTGTYYYRVKAVSPPMTDSAWRTGSNGVAVSAISISPATLANYTIGSGEYNDIVIAAGGTKPYTFALDSGTLPPGVGVFSNGQIWGVPTVPGTYNFTVKVTDSAASPVTTTRSYTVVVSPATSLSITTGSLAGYTIGSGEYNSIVSATGGVAPYTFTVTAGTVPPGVGVFSNGQVWGVPTVPGNYTFTVTATDAANFTANHQYNIQVLPSVALSVATASLPDYSGTGEYSQIVTATGGVPPYTFAATGTVPPGTAVFFNGQVWGVPNTPGTYNFTVTVTDAMGITANQPYTVIVP